MACDHCERAGQPCECEGDCPECLSDLREAGLTAEQQAEVDEINEAIPLCSRCGKPAPSSVESPDGKVGCLDCFQSFLSADGTTRLLKGWHKDVQCPAEPVAIDPRSWQSIMDSLLLYVGRPSTNLLDAECRKKVEEIAGPCDIVHLGQSAHITRLTPNPDGTHLEITIDY